MLKKVPFYGVLLYSDEIFRKCENRQKIEFSSTNLQQDLFIEKYKEICIKLNRSIWAVT